MTQIRDAIEADFASIVTLNEVEAHQTSAMDEARLRYLISLSSYCKVVGMEGRVAAFLIAMREGAAYENDNYEWFAKRYPQFLYVDRIVVGAQFAGHKLGSKLYQDLFAYAKAQQLSAITCEYNIEPPNPASNAFHNKFGFKEAGSQWVANGSKLVSLQVAVV